MTHDHLPKDLADEIVDREVLAREKVFDGYVWDVVRETVDLGEAGQVTRDFVDHTGAVAIAAVRGTGDDLEILLLQQYRHPVRTKDWELPAGLLDVDGEPPLVGAQRELAEEAQLAAADWRVLVDIFTTPGGNSENIRIFLARDLREHVLEDFVVEGEEVGMTVGWLPVRDAATAVLEGRIHNGITVAAVLAILHASVDDFASLRPADAPWPTQRGRGVA